VIVASLVALLAGLIPINFLAEMTSIGMLVAFVVVSIGVIVPRRTAPNLPRGFRVPGYPITPILSVIGCLWIITSLETITVLAFGAWTVAALVFYFRYGRKHSLLATSAPRVRQRVEEQQARR
jgi:basic amino acid/polyamine antiporter, APA family